MRTCVLKSSSVHPGWGGRLHFLAEVRRSEAPRSTSFLFPGFFFQGNDFSLNIDRHGKNELHDRDSKQGWVLILVLFVFVIRHQTPTPFPIGFNGNWSDPDHTEHKNCSMELVVI